MTVRSILMSKSKDLIRIDPDTPIGAVTEILDKHNIGAVLVMQGDDLLGVLSDRGIVRAMARNPNGVRAMAARHAMKPRKHETTPSATLEEAMQIMTTHRVRYLPVFEAGSLVGIASIGDVVKALLQRQNTAVESLTAYIGMS